MKKLPMITGTLIVILSTLSGCTQQTGITIDGYDYDWQNIPVFIQDRKGDVTNEQRTENNISRDIFEFDVTSIKIAIDTSNLYILVELANDSSYYFTHNREYGRVIGELYFNTDNNSNTGGNAFASNRTGFDSKFNIYTGVWNTFTGYAISGRMKLENITEKTELSYFVEYYSSLYNSSTQEFQQNNSKIVKSYDKPNLIIYKGKYIEMKLPIEDLGISHINQTIRVLFAERGNGVGEESFSEATGTIYQIKSL